MATQRAVRILLIDDEPVQRQAMRLALQSKGYVCFEASSAAEGLTAVVDEQADVVLLEWLLSSGGGMGLARQLRQRCAAAGRTVRIAIVSTTDEPDGVLEAEDVDRYFTKPVDINEIARWIASP